MKRGAVAETMQVINVVNDQPYCIRLEMEKCPFAAGQIVIGSLVPWRGEWYWSGGQQMWQKAETGLLAALKKEYVEKLSVLAYRYCADLAQKARDIVREHHRQFVAHHGDDLAVFSDGLSLAAAAQKRMRALFDERAEGIVADVMKRYGLHNPWPRLQFPDAFLKHRDGIGAFFNPDEGEEYMLSFNQVCSAFRKQDASLTDNEAESVRALIENQNISPAFVQRLVREHGCGAIGRAYLIRGFQQMPHLAWLLRRFKGKFYRTRYPAISFTQGGVADSICLSKHVVDAREPLQLAEIARATGLDEDYDLPPVLDRLAPFLSRRENSDTLSFISHCLTGSQGRRRKQVGKRLVLTTSA